MLVFPAAAYDNPGTLNLQPNVSINRDLMHLQNKASASTSVMCSKTVLWVLTDNPTRAVKAAGAVGETF